MVTRDAFEEFAHGLASSTCASAQEFAPGAEASIGFVDTAILQEFAQEIQVLADAVGRLNADPSIRSVDADGFFTYEDPILANAALAARAYASPESFVGEDTPGAELTSKHRWVLMAVRLFAARLRSDSKIKDLASRTPRAPLTIDSRTMRIAVVGDAGQKGQPQDRVLDMILERHGAKPFDVLVHLGDVYFASSPAEMLRNFLAPFSVVRNAGCRVVSLCGNHDLYYGSEAYLDALDVLGQPGRFFSIENEHWRVACLDTSLGALEIMGNDGNLDAGQRSWLHEILARRDGKRAVLMSHHFIVSGWDSPAQSLKRQLADTAKSNVFAWYWGHEHRAAVYDRGDHGFFGASVGNGVFPEAWSRPTKLPAPAWYSDKRCTCFKQADYCPHGFAELEFHADRLLETIHLENGETLESELKDTGSFRAHNPG